MRRRQASRGIVMFWPMFCWETLDPGIHVDVTLAHTTYLKIVTDHVHHFMAMVFTDGSDLFRQDNAHCKTLFENRNGLRNMMKSSSFPRSQSDGISMGCAGPKSDSGGPPCNLQDLKELLLMCQILQDKFRGLVKSMPRCIRAALAAQGGLTWH